MDQINGSRILLKNVLIEDCVGDGVHTEGDVLLEAENIEIRNVGGAGINQVSVKKSSATRKFVRDVAVGTISTVGGTYASRHIKP